MLEKETLTVDQNDYEIVGEDVMRPVVGMVATHPFRLKTLDDLFARPDYARIEFCNPSDASSLITNNEIECFIIEVRVSDAYKDIDWIPRIRRERPLAPILAINSNDNFELKLLTYLAGATEVVNHELHIDELLLKVRAYCELGRALRILEVQNVQLINTVEALRISENEKGQSQKIMLRSTKMASLGELAANLAHEINNPLSILVSRIHALRSRITVSNIHDDEITRLLERISTVTSRIGSITRGLVTFSKGGSRDSFKSVSVKALINDTVSFAAESIKGAGILLDISDVSASLTIDCRETQISQVLVNLLTNAKDAVEGTTNPKINIEVIDRGDMIDILVSDSGAGVPLEIESKIFEQYFTTKSEDKGTGLGLSVSRNLVNDHKGTLTIDRSKGPSTFKVTLPKIQLFKKSN
jgi:C4-dicarboxylate-specific signal transduction histidine kinase